MTIHNHFLKPLHEKTITYLDTEFGTQAYIHLIAAGFQIVTA